MKEGGGERKRGSVCKSTQKSLKKFKRKEKKMKKIKTVPRSVFSEIFSSNICKKITHKN